VGGGAHLHANDLDRLVPAAERAADRARRNAVERAELLAFGHSTRLPDRLLGQARNSNPAASHSRG